MKEVCGFEDNNGKFWKTKEETQRANERYERQTLGESIQTKIEKLFNRRAYTCSGGYYIYSNQFRDVLVDYPEEILSILWEITRYNFNKKFNEAKI